MGRAYLVAAAVAAIGLLCACGKKPETTYTVKGPDGASATVSAGQSAVAGKLPPHVELYPGGQVDVSVASGDGAGGTLSFHTAAKPAEVIAFYKDKAAKAGMAEAFNTQSAGTETFSASKDNGASSMVVITSASEGQTQVQVTWSQPKQG